MAKYQHSGVVNCDIDFDTSPLKGRTAIVTGGANGLGEAYARALHEVGMFVCIGDVNVERGEKLQSELPNLKFVKCDTANWDDQVQLFKTAAESSPTGKIHYVVANAGIARPDEVFSYSGDDAPPKKPSLTTIEVNVHGPLYTTNLALHYFIRQNGKTVSPTQEDTCLVLIASGASFCDVPDNPQYLASKWGIRGIMHSMRSSTHHYGSRINIISPWYVRTAIVPAQTFDAVVATGLDLATTDDAAQCLLRILSDRGVNGRALFVGPRKWTKRGYVDLDIDDLPAHPLVRELQDDQARMTPFERELGL